MLDTFNLSQFGFLHTLIALVAVACGIVALVRHGRHQHGQVTELKSIVKCPKCHTKMRLPRGRRLWANCPSCKNKFRADT